MLEKANQDLSWQVAMLTRGHPADNSSQPHSPRNRAGAEADKAADPGAPQPAQPFPKLHADDHSEGQLTACGRGVRGPQQAVGLPYWLWS